MKKITEEMLGLSGFRYDYYVHWSAYTVAGSRFCFNNSNPLRRFHYLVSWDVRNKIYSEINEIVYDKTNNLNITESYEKLKR